MPIQVFCKSCKSRFNVSDKFAGQKGPCPKCKAIIEVPAKSEEVVVHAPQEYGPKGTTGQGVLKPIARTETKISPIAIGAIIGAVLLVLVAALVLRAATDGKPGYVILTLGAIVLAPPLAFAGYTFLREQELEPYRGREMLVRTAICAAVYAALWGVVAWVKMMLFPDTPLEMFHMLFFVPPLVMMGGLGGFASYDLEYTTGMLHYGMYLLVTVLLRLIIGLPAI